MKIDRTCLPASFFPVALFLAALFLTATTVADEAEEATAPETAAAEDATSEDAATEDTASEDVAPETPAAEHPSADEPLPEDYSCSFCHADEEQFSGDEAHLLVTEADLEGDIHWQRGLRCHDCHGGNPDLMEYEDHRKDATFKGIAPAEIPELCGSCHSKIEIMRRYSPSARTDQESEYWTSGHGQRLKATSEDESVETDEDVATCVDCHGKDGMLAVDNQKSPVYPTNVAETCAKCHADEKMMAGRTYPDRALGKDRALGHDQYEHWKESVHGKAMLEKGDVSAPTCNDCHGNHGAMPPDVDSVANACGGCHGKVADLFAETRMKHKFEKVGLPGCAACHDNHQIVSPTDEMLGMGSGTICIECHEQEKVRYEATLAGAMIAKTMRDGLDQLKLAIAEAEAVVEEAETLGMEVSGPSFELHQAKDALTNARSLIHGFSVEPVEEALAEGRKVAEDVKSRAEEALQDYTNRRVWLAASLLPILIVIVLLVLYIRVLPIPKRQ